jgi:aspartate 1-decarboxylase
MLRSLLRSKIHRATVTEADVNYIGSLSIDEELAEEAGLQEYEEVMIADLDSGERLWTYVILADRGSRTIGMNGAAAIKISKGHKIIIFAFALYDEEETLNHKPRLVFVDGDNNPMPGPVSEKHAQIV